MYPRKHYHLPHRLLAPLCLTISLLTLNHFALASEPQSGSRPNILFIAVDDLRPELGAYGASHITSPNIDRLATSSLVFKRAYCMVATCGASRSSMLTSVRPTKDRFLTHLARADKEVPWATTLHSHLKDHGYHTVSLGKVFHSLGDSIDGWSEKPWTSNLPIQHNPAKRSGVRGESTEMEDVPDDAYQDGEIAQRAFIELEKRAQQPDKPFFLAVGFKKPHLPFTAPQKYWDLYPENKIQLPENYFIPKNAPKLSIHSFGELRNYSDIPKNGPLSEAKALQLIRGYYACVSYVDAQIGKVLNQLETLGLDQNTIVVLWGDHGWNLGDHTLWCKHSVFESSLHIPLIVKAPGYASGTETNALTESIDIFPTLCELAGLPTPTTVEGKSFVPLLKFPERPSAELAASRHGSGDSIRTDKYRYSEYSKNGKIQSHMLYDHELDPLETENIVDNEALAETREALSKKLHRVMKSTHTKAPQTPSAH